MWQSFIRPTPSMLRAQCQLVTAGHTANDLGAVSGASPEAVFYGSEPLGAMLTLISFKALPRPVGANALINTVQKHFPLFVEKS